MATKTQAPKAKSKLNWKAGKPPHIGWWMASVDKDERSWRWWNGTVWSLNVHSHRAARTAGHRAKKPSKNSAFVRWTDAYPANARVPRVAPTK